MPRKSSEHLAGVTQAELAGLLNYSREQVRQWTQSGMPRRDDQKYIVADCVAWLRRQERERAAAQLAAPTDEAEARARKVTAEAALKELELATARGEVVPVEEFRAFVEKFVGGFAAVTLGRLHSFERDIVATETAGGARKLTERMQRALMEGAQDYADLLEQEAEATADA